jgi:long-chain acyl-CoA synthetase
MSRENLASMIRSKTSLYGDATAMYFKEGSEWQEISYRELGQRIGNLAGGLLELGVEPGDRVGIMAQNSPEWAIADFAIQSVGGISVPIYATNTAGQAQYITNDAGLKVIFAGSAEEREKIETFVETSTIERVVMLDGSPFEPSATMLSFSELLAKGRDAQRGEELESILTGINEEDVATIIYTSGTTGEPKGVMLTHGNFYHQFHAMEGWFSVTPEDRSLSFLPLSHVYERTWSYYVFHQGAQNWYVRDPKQVIAYLSEVRPTAMVSAPRLYEKIYSAVHDKLSQASATRQKLFHWAVATGSEYAKAKHAGEPIGAKLKVKHAVADKLVLHKIRDIVGGPKNFFSAGGAAMAAEIEDLFFAAGILVCRGYGLTETSPMLTANCPGAFRFGTVGRPVAGCEIKLADDGEILAKGPNVMKGYYNKPEATDRVLRDGWLYTGDIGVLSEDGYLSITDRKKDLIITSGGKNVAPQRIETAVGKDHYIEQIAVVGERQPFIGALIVPFFTALEELAERKKWEFKSRVELIQLPEVLQFFRERIDAQSGELANYERIKEFRLLPDDFTLAGGEITPTLKVKRNSIAMKYQNLVEDIYG